jgi:D-glycero-alpha-D-manno-heptose-7-phosphate kinase
MSGTDRDLAEAPTRPQVGSVRRTGAREAVSRVGRAPLRVSFFGGGTDSPEFVAAHGPGLVLGTAIDKYVEHSGGRTSSPVPPGTGLGSSSAEVVARLGSSLVTKGYDLTHGERSLLAWAAWEHERDAGSFVGWQDAVFAAHGGLNLIEFQSGASKVTRVATNRIEELGAHLLLVYSGSPRGKDSTIERRKIDAVIAMGDQLKLARRMAEEGHRMLTGTDSMALFGSLLRAAWETKRLVAAGISNACVDEAIERGVDAGAFGGKLLGAGEGGFVLFVVSPERRASVLAAVNLTELPLRIDAPGFSGT